MFTTRRLDVTSSPRRLVEVRDVHKAFGTTPALQGLELDVEAGEVHGFLGPNGSGKSTTIRVLLGLLRADSGTVRLLGGDPWTEAATLHRRIAYVPGDVALWPHLTGGEIIDLLGRLRGGVSRERQRQLVEELRLDPTKRADTYSRGNRQKVALVAALAADVDLLLLDEPTSGLDPLMEAVFSRHVRAFRDRGGGVLLSSHVLGEVERLCDRVTLIRDGRTLESGTLVELRHLSRTSVEAVVDRVPTGLAALPGVSGLTVEGDRVRCEVETAHLAGVVRLLGDAGVRALTSNPPSLEDLFLRHYDSPVGPS